MHIAFTVWKPLDREHLDAIPLGLAAVQLRRADGLVSYPTGKSTLVCFLFSEDTQKTLERLCGAELERPGAMGQGPLWFRYLLSEDAEEIIGKRYLRFVQRFGSPPVLQTRIMGE